MTWSLLFDEIHIKKDLYGKLYKTNFHRIKRQIIDIESDNEKSDHSIFSYSILTTVCFYIQ